MRPFHSHFWSLWWASRRGKQTLVENYGVKFSYNLGILPKLLSTMILSTPYVLFSSPYIFSVALFCFLSTWTSQKCLHLIRFVREEHTHIFLLFFFYCGKVNVFLMQSFLLPFSHLAGNKWQFPYFGSGSSVLHPFYRLLNRLFIFFGIVVDPKVKHKVMFFFHLKPDPCCSPTPICKIWSFFVFFCATFFLICPFRVRPMAPGW